MINPLRNAYDWFLDLWSVFPSIYTTFVLMFLFIFAIIAIFNFMRK